VKLSNIVALAAVPVLWLAPAYAGANSLRSADLEATCEGFSVEFTAALGASYTGFVNYQINVTPVAPGTPIVRALAIAGNPVSTLVTVGESVAFPAALEGSVSISGVAQLSGTTSQLPFNGGVPVVLECTPERPSISLKKEVSVPGVDGWFDANDEASAPTAPVPSDAQYRLTVTNTGNVQLDDVVVNDPSLGLVDVAVGTLAVGEVRVLTSATAGFEALFAPERCDEAGTVVNLASVAGHAPEDPQIVTAEDPALLICVEVPRGDEGCTPGYWKQAHHFDSWNDFAPSDSYAAVFGVTPSFDKTLLGALKQGGGGEKALGRHATAALLNASSEGVDYAFTVDEVIAIVQTAYATGNFERAKNELADANESRCPLN